MLQEETLRYTASPSYLSQVFFYFGLAILMSAAGTFIGLNYFAAFFLANPILMYVLFAAELILIFTSRMWSETRPLNYVLFSTFAFITGITIVPLIALFMMEFQGVTLIIKALVATTAMFSATALFGWVTQKDLSGLRGFLMISLIGIIVVSIIGIFIPWGNNFEMIFAGFGVILFSGYTMYDIQQIKSSPGLSPIDAALRLYLDIFNLFIFILRLMGAFARD
jgi:FtsH-binding integral membrane protein